LDMPAKIKPKPKTRPAKNENKMFLVMAIVPIYGE
jgi:hypothetical protein